jgi:AcrR family transcriptional regulator
MSFRDTFQVMNPVALSKRALDPEMAQLGLREKKQKLTKEAIWEAAIDLFAEKGFDETTIDEIAEVAFVSRRSFFRYFESKDDLMAQPIVSLVDALKKAVQSSPKTASKAELFRSVVSMLARGSSAQPRTTKVMEVAARYPAARHALATSMASVQNQIEDAFRSRFKDPLTIQVLSSMTLSALSLATHHWYESGQKDIEFSIRKVFSAFADIACGLDGPSR